LANGGESRYNTEIKYVDMSTFVAIGVPFRVVSRFANRYPHSKNRYFSFQSTFTAPDGLDWGQNFTDAVTDGTHRVDHKLRGSFQWTRTHSASLSTRLREQSHRLGAGD
jgi:hypothetical protein